MEEAERYLGELVLQPLVRRRVEVLVAPERREAHAIGEARQPAHRVVALVVGGLHEQGERLGREALRLESPLRIHVGRQPRHQGNRIAEFPPRGGRHHGVEGDGVADDQLDLGNEPRDGRQHEARRALTVDDGFDFIPARLPDDRLDGAGMIVDGRLIERPFAGLDVDARAPVFQPYVIAIREQRIDERLRDGGPEDVGAHPRPVDKHHGAPSRRLFPLDVEQMEFPAIARQEGNGGVCVGRRP
ncbi:hypothetical protein STIAU_8016 [Stigmatella aurantiaca DW4/3-1]|uniref:Uncharacterized protein n=1 Tax=Stigmatella aurantiaca (strain DW4/3-1) TaxID=378806 RepID=Q09C20_STIAD|nr:hypothetical protein STIAU_8016 [Stigmatella aurantiaca DW4/3-1]